MSQGIQVSGSRGPEGTGVARWARGSDEGALAEGLRAKVGAGGPKIVRRNQLLLNMTGIQRVFKRAHSLNK